MCKLFENDEKEAGDDTFWKDCAKLGSRVVQA